jgi:hypothetical protein
MRNSNSSPTITNCTFSNNTTPRDGGGMRNYQSSPVLTNCIFSNNTANWGGGMYNYQSNTTFINCTFSGNMAGAVGRGGGMLNYNSSSPTVTNSILWGNIPEQIVDYDHPSSSTIVNYSDVQGGWGGAGNINAEPCFVDPNNPDPNLQNLRLKPASPCIDAGDTTVVTWPLDSDGNPRAIDDPHTPNTGQSISGSLNVVDMGVYEFQPCRIAGDINCDGVVDFRDVAILCANWLADTEPEL